MTKKAKILLDAMPVYRKAMNEPNPDYMPAKYREVRLDKKGVRVIRKPRKLKKNPKFYPLYARTNRTP
jgi:hypothetical protein